MHRKYWLTPKCEKKTIKLPSWCGSVDWVPACEPRGGRFDSQSGHMRNISKVFEEKDTWEVTVILLLFCSMVTAPPPVPSFPVPFDSLLKKLLKTGSIHGSIFYRECAVKGELQNLILSLAPLCHKLFHRNHGGCRDRKGQLLYFSLCVYYIYLIFNVSIIKIQNQKSPGFESCLYLLELCGIG